ncbi:MULTISPECIES: hypothetical protein [Burkholderia cepacia complex]|uniref:hypothetical protein n=1 Tax=Burkholderia cepacia complex TaxID=87882 RepID=UPI00075C230F|nr:MULTISPECIES: hypothetical protein [Burkholderia cepacia complex]KWA26694.1 hypothetical protein WT39_20095 [Burkholderia territorii]CAJ3521779.1 Uncharacterised protein [Burkholderia pseudomallei]
MVWYAGLLDKGLTLAGDFLSYLREGDARSHEMNLTVAATSTEANAKLARAIDDVARKLEGAVQSIVGNIVEKLERDQLELLTAQVKSVHFALEFENDGMLGPAVTRIMELIAYAKNRIAEGKEQWLGPWLMAESVRIIALRRLASSERALALVQSEANAFRLSILDYSGQSLVSNGNVPWVKIAEFVRGENEDVVHLISQSIRINSPKERAREASDAVEEEAPTTANATAAPAISAPAATVKTALNPAAAWPFPTGSCS